MICATIDDKDENCRGEKENNGNLLASGNINRYVLTSS